MEESSTSPALVAKAWQSTDGDKIYVQWIATDCKFVEFEPGSINIRVRIFNLIRDPGSYSTRTFPRHIISGI